ncbi:hypothetical protein [Hymenobacter nivis]|uniref:Uncharacterized protein n=1 Tax=Hymenobacter nivis TaxID=1850093 RepID=A0A502GYP3_9BACT|nr:hypothetical protein [Hymenobacter nivis]TPG66093.1 hypothetical protein EAH73_12040 [Hymenobacter nivis]
MDQYPLFAVTLVASPPPTAPPLLDLQALHAKLLPLALEAGHTALSLSAHYAGDVHGAHYEACATGGDSGYRRYISWLEPGDADRGPHFERVLTEKLSEQRGYQAAVNTCLAKSLHLDPSTACPA